MRTIFLVSVETVVSVRHCLLDPPINHANGRVCGLVISVVNPQARSTKRCTQTVHSLIGSYQGYSS